MANKPLPSPDLDWPVPYAAVSLLCNSENCLLKAYKCPAGVLTIGWGETAGVYEGETCTPEQADQMLLRAVKSFTASVSKLCKVPTNANQLGALVCFAYNAGIEALAESTLLNAHNAGSNIVAAKSFALYDKAHVDGVLTVMPGLVIRRARESALYLTPVPAVASASTDAPADVAPLPAPEAPAEADPAPLPQAVAARPSLLKNPLALASATTAATSAFNALSGAADQAQTVTNAVSTVATTAQTTVTNVQNAVSTTKDVVHIAHSSVHAASAFIGVEPWMLVSAALIAVSLGIAFHLRSQRAAGAV